MFFGRESLLDSRSVVYAVKELGFPSTFFAIVFFRSIQITGSVYRASVYAVRFHQGSIFLNGVVYH